MAVKIRYAKAEDIDSVLGLWWQLQRFHTDELGRRIVNPGYAHDAEE
ncbi:hypothetical protein H0O00_04780 [Candidatus Micrarchaeota archaeon]|nr:hypothetical protein [Candidatus Micrarchaeota archaeon]